MRRGALALGCALLAALLAPAGASAHAVLVGASPQRGATRHSSCCGPPPSASTQAATYSGVGGTTGRPSVKPWA